MNFSGLVFFSIILLSSSLSARAGFQKSVLEVTRVRGGETYHFRMDPEAMPSSLAISADNFDLQVRDVVLELENGSFQDVLGRFSPSADGRVIISAGETEIVTLDSGSRLIGLSLTVESIGGMGDLFVRVGGEAGSPSNLNRPARSQAIICARVENGYRPVYLESGEAVNAGFFFEQATCERAISQQRKGLICVISGEAVWPYSLERKKIIGNHAGRQAEHCFNQIESARRGLICLMGPRIDQSGLYNLSTDSFIDETWRSTEECRQTLNRLGGERRPNRPDGGNRPGENQPPEFISSSDFEALLRVVSEQAFDDRRNGAIEPFLRNIQNAKKKLSMDMLLKLLPQYSFDDGKLGLIRLVRPSLVIELGKVDQVAETLVHRSGRTSARQILLAN